MKIPSFLVALPCSALLLTFSNPSAGFAEDLQGADAILKQLDAQLSKDSDPAKKLDPFRQLRADAKQYLSQSDSLPLEEAARAWLALFDRALTVPQPSSWQRYGGQSPASLLEVLRVLPSPRSWDALAARIAARPLPAAGSVDRSVFFLRIVGGMLQGKLDAVRQSIDALMANDAETVAAQSAQHYAVESLRTAFFTLVADKENTLREFERKLALLHPDDHVTAADAAEREALDMNELEVPDLVALAGPARAEKLLKDIFGTTVRGVSIRDARTKALARKVALEMGDRLKFAPWSLVDTLDSAPLYELLARRFADTNPPEQSERQTAEAYYLLALIAGGRNDDAAALALKLGNNSSLRSDDDSSNFLPEEALNELAADGRAQEVARFFGRLLGTHPELPYWSSYTAAAVLAGETDAMLAEVKAAAERPDLKPRLKTALRKDYGEALLAADHVAEALPILEESAAAFAHLPDTFGRHNAVREEAQAHLRLASLGMLLGDDALRNEQLDAVIKVVKAQPDAAGGLNPPFGDLPELFLSAKRGPDLERLLAANLVSEQRQILERRAEQHGIQDGGETQYEAELARTPLCELVDFYAQSGRDADVVALLDHAKQWGAPDMAKLLNSGHNLGRKAALALQKTGHADAALRVVNAFLERSGAGDDPSYALLLELLPPDRAEARLNELFQGDQFEERPLIWRAVLQLRQNRLDDAEKSARQAISIDPSDGEQGRGDRMRAYSVLGDILERKGDAAQAAQMRQAVKAIRLSEDADRYHEAGLLTRAVAMYEQALGYFSNAYCIQSRLAVQLTALGKTDEAMTHYERAYELMPESFGRMESHCFGCERAFAGVRAQATAERVFQRLVAKQPDNPRVHYLLGYLRNEEEHPAEAAQEFREAVRLDPDYINAWKQLASVADKPADRDLATLNLLRLDPRRRHDAPDFTEVTDLRALWSAVEAAAKFTLPEPSNLYPLAASKTALEQHNLPSSPTAVDPTVDQATENLFRPNYRSDSNEPLTLRGVILKNKVIVQALPLLTGDVATADSTEE